jgi:hypothetical protein
MTTWVNSQFPRPDFHRQVQRHYGLQDTGTPTDYEGTETVTYYYGSSFPVAEPASLVMLTLGLAVVAGLAWRHRKVAHCSPVHPIGCV